MIVRTWHPGEGSELVLPRKARQQTQTASSHGAAPETIQPLVERARVNTGADGAALAVSFGGDDLRCAASSGAAPPVGTRLDPDTGLTGLCFRRGQALLCRDTDADARVDAAACRALGIRCVLALPLIEGRSVVGVLELLASEPDAFKECPVSELVRGINAAMVKDVVEPISSNVAQPNETQNCGAPKAHLSRWARRMASAALLLAAAVYGFREHRLGKTSYGSSVRTKIHVTPFTGTTVLPPHPRHTAQSTSVTDLRSAASRGDAEAAYILGTAYEQGKGVPQNYGQAMDWFLRAAANGNALAEWRLGLGYLNAFGREEDDRRAAEWFKRAANQVNVPAQFALSRLYLTGRGVPLDYVRAYTWATIAAQGSSRDEQLLTSIRMHMTRQQINEAHHRVSLWNAWIRSTALHPLHTRDMG
ncbi:MAG TPA: GAF domain-containing protein [Terriglobales bacterium]|nr:GAF domain-containing protein [Terriglobales bacterium]